MTYSIANLQSCILYIYSTNIDTEYFKHGTYSFFLSSKCSLFHNSNIFDSCIIHILYTGCAKFKINNNSGAKILIFALRNFLRTRLKRREVRRMIIFFYPQKYRNVKSEFRDATVDDFDKLCLISD